jgi:hypothetical protein
VLVIAAILTRTRPRRGLDEPVPQWPEAHVSARFECDCARLPPHKNDG